MKTVKITIDDALYTFYKTVGENAGGLPVEQVMAVALFKLAGELALNAMHQKERKAADKTGTS